MKNPVDNVVPLAKEGHQRVSQGLVWTGNVLTAHNGSRINEMGRETICVSVQLTIHTRWVLVRTGRIILRHWCMKSQLQWTHQMTWTRQTTEARHLNQTRSQARILNLRSP